MYVHTCVCGVFCLKYLPFINTLTTVFLSLFGHVISLMGATKWMGPCVDNLQFLFYLNVFKVPIAVSWRGGSTYWKGSPSQQNVICHLDFFHFIFWECSMNWHCHWPMSLPVQKQPIILDGAEALKCYKKCPKYLLVITIFIL